MAALTPERNDHHGLPRSWGGSNWPVNITRMSKERHDAFHGIFGHQPPDFAVRTMLLSSILERRPTLSARTAESALVHLTPADWRDNYAPRALRIRQGNGEAREYLAGVALHLANRLHQELRLVLEGIGMLQRASWPPADVREFNGKVERFFRTDDPALHLRRFLVEQDVSGEFCWSKPLRPSLRLAVAELVAEDPLEVPGRAMVPVLVDHHRRLLHAALRWEPHVDPDAFRPAQQRLVLQGQAS